MADPQKKLLYALCARPGRVMGGGGGVFESSTLISKMVTVICKKELRIFNLIKSEMENVRVA